MRSTVSLFLLFLFFCHVFSAQNELPIDTSELTGRVLYSGDVIWVMNADGSDPVPLTDASSWDFDAAWSPDGMRIVFRSHRDGNEEIYVMNADGSDQINISNNPGSDWSPEWSPDGSRIVFFSQRDGISGIWTMNADGTDVTLVAAPPGVNDYPSWSPDGEKIVWNCSLSRTQTVGSRRTADFEICIVNVDGTELMQLTDTEGTNKFPAWSPDSRLIAFVSTRDGWPTTLGNTPDEYDPEVYGDEEIYVMNTDGSNQRNLTNNPSQGDAFPAWSPDGYIAFTRHGGCIMVMRGDGTGITQMNEGTCADGGHFVSWYQPKAEAD